MNGHANLAKMKADREKIQAETATIRAETKAMRDKRMETRWDDRKESTACQDAMEGTIKKMEPHSEEKEAIVERQEISNEMVAVHSLKACRSYRAAS
jgi:hypothetical protein